MAREPSIPGYGLFLFSRRGINNGGLVQIIEVIQKWGRRSCQQKLGSIRRGREGVHVEVLLGYEPRFFFRQVVDPQPVEYMILKRDVPILFLSLPLFVLVRFRIATQKCNGFSV